MATEQEHPRKKNGGVITVVEKKTTYVTNGMD